jgi:type I restriction enzyme R subunit
MKIRFAYATNGKGFYGVDMLEGSEGEQPTFPTPDELWQKAFAAQNEWRDRFAAVPFEDKGGYFENRYYQDIAIEKVLEAIAANKSRMEPEPQARPSPENPVSGRPQYSCQSGVYRLFRLC